MEVLAETHDGTFADVLFDLRQDVLQFPIVGHDWSLVESRLP